MKSRIIFIVLSFFILSTIITCKKTEELGTIQGKITDAKSGQAISGASVQLDKTNSTSTSNGDGTYSFADLAPNTYTVTVTKSGFVVNPKTVSVAAGQTQTADFQMEMPSILIFPTTYSAQALAGTTNLTITANANWAAVSSEPSWLSCTPSGTGNGVISVNYTANNSTNARTGTITVTATGLTPQIFTISQFGLTPTFNITPINQNVTTNAGNTTFTISSNCSWSVASDQSWCTVSPLNGTGNATLTATYTENKSISERKATITITIAGLPNQSVTVTQAAFVPSFTITPSNQNVTSVAGNTTFTITSNVSWSATSDQPWCTLNPTNGSGNATLTANYIENTTTSQKKATITIVVTGLSNQTVTVTQAAFIPTLNVTPANQNVNSSAGTTNFNVSANVTWSATSDQTWCTLTNASGNGNGSITANFVANTTAGNRVANITITGNGVTSQVVSVTQSYVPPSLTVSPSNQNVIATAGNTSFTITSNISWTATSDQTWCTFTTNSGTGNGTLTANYTANTTNSSRTANLTISGSGVSNQIVTVTQASGIPTSGLVAYYPFNGNANDESGNGNNGTVNGATPATDRKNNVNSAFSFNGINNSITTPDNSNLYFSSSNFTISYWTKFTTLKDTYFMGQSNGGGYTPKWIIMFSKTTNKLSLYVHSTENPTSPIDFNFSWIPSTNLWYNIVIKRDNNNLYLFINHNFIGSQAINILLPNCSSAFSIGILENSACVNGSLDDLRIYNRALSDSEIQQLYNE